MDRELGKILSGFVKTWNKLVATGLWLLLVLGSFFLPPPVGVGQFGSDGKLTGFARFVVVAFVGLIVVPVSRWGKKRHTWRWWSGAVIALVLSVGSFFTYEWFSTHWTCSYAGKPVVVGSEFMPGKEQWTKTNGAYTTTSDWVMAHAGQIEQIWTKQSIDLRCALLALFYILGLPLLVLAIICVVQAVYCNWSEKRKGNVT